MGTTAIRYLYYEEPPEVGPGGIGVNPSNYKVSYSPLEASSSSVNVRVNEGGVPVTPQITSMAISWGDGIFRNLIVGQDYHGMSVSRKIENSQVVVGFNFIQGASFEGTVQVNLAYKGQPYVATIDVAPDAVQVSVECEASSIVYNPVAASLQQFSVRLYLNGESANYAFTAYFRESGGDVLAYPANPAVVHKGVQLLYSPGVYTLVSSAGATYEGALILQLTSGDISRNVTIPITRVTNGQNGAPGPRGSFIRGPRLWVDVKNAHNSPTDEEKFYSGAAGEPFVDVVIYLGKFYICKATHLVRVSPTPISDRQAWQQFSDIDFVATKVLLAEKGYIQNLIAEEVLMVNSDNKVVFALVKDSQGRSYLQANYGTFGQMTVEGDIKCNTQTYALPEWTANDTKLTENKPNGEVILETIPLGGCMIIPKGWCHHRIKLPTVNQNEARQVLVINQNLPCRGTNPLERKVTLKPLNEDVYIFTDPESSAENKRASVGGVKEEIPLGFGVFNLVGYQADFWIDGAKSSKTVWSMWQGNNSNFTMPTFNPSGFTVKQGNGLPIYNNNIPNI